MTRPRTPPPVTPSFGPRRGWRALVLGLCLGVGACRQLGPVTTRIEARPAPPRVAVAPGVRPLNLGTAWYRGMRRDGTLLIPAAAASGTPVPLLVVLHGGGGRADDYRFMLPLADERGVALLLLDARHNTWDGVDSPFGPDVRFIDQALAHTFDRVAIDPTRIALGGLSDGGMYALSVGVANGDLFTHLIAVSAGFMNPPGPPVGTPRILLGHGRRDTVYGIGSTRDRLFPRLREAGYDVSYFEFDGPHFITPEAARVALEWLVQ